MVRAFILNDYLVDLISENGSMYCGADAQQIEDAICDYMDLFIKSDDYIAVCLDTHRKNDPYHPETFIFPVHNIKDSDGHKIYGRVGKKVEELSKSHPWHITVIEKVRYSAFVGTDLDIWLRSRNVNEVIVSGVCTDICVLHTVIDAYGLCYKITVPRNVCFSNNKSAEEFALNHMQETMGVVVL